VHSCIKMIFLVEELQDGDYFALNSGYEIICCRISKLLAC
jgi:hypothetical protein